MRVPVQIISFSCFLFSVTVVRGQDIRCEVPRDQHVYNPHSYFRGDMKLGAKKTYYCLDGYEQTAAVATCTRDGWTPKPLCADIRCEVPRDQHVFNLHSYFREDMKLGAKIPYYCLDGYEQTATVATCTRNGWTPKPLCAGKMCAAPNIPNAEIVGGQRPNYNINSRIQYKCRPGFEPEQPVEIICNSQTKWTGIQQCTDIRCEVPRDQHVFNLHSYFRGDMKLGAKILYYCLDGYEKTAIVATCTRDGWTPKPLCAAQQILCPDLSVENGLIHTLSSNEEEIFYTCNTGYKPFSGNWWDSVTCSKGSWSEKPRCIREEECGAFPSVHHGKLKQTKQLFHDGDTTAFECDPGFIPTQRSIKCVSGTWETPVCKVDVHCGFPPKVENALITSKPEEFYGDGSSVTYVCRSSFLMNGKSTVFCRSGTWEETPTCKEPTCPLNTPVEDLIMERLPDTEGPVKPGHKLIFSCNREWLKLKGQREITCLPNGEWSGPFPECEEVMCVAKLTVNMRSDVTEDRRTGPEVSVRSGHTITLSCVGKGVNLQGRSTITCLSNGEWSNLFPKCVGGKCGPPPHVNFADTVEMTKNEYDSGERVEYRCFNIFTMVQHQPYSKYLTCDQGEWRGNIKCLKPCSVTVEKMDERGIELRWSDQEKIFSPHGDRITFRCKRGKYSIGSDLKQTCNDGVMNWPLCE